MNIVDPTLRGLRLCILVRIVLARLNSGCARRAHQFLHAPRESCASIAGTRKDPYAYLVVPERKSLLPITVIVALASKSFFAKIVHPRRLLARQYESAHYVGDLPHGVVNTSVRINLKAAIVVNITMNCV